jgi:MoxR-like ATPase
MAVADDRPDRPAEGEPPGTETNETRGNERQGTKKAKTTTSRTTRRKTQPMTKTKTSRSRRTSDGDKHRVTVTDTEEDAFGDDDDDDDDDDDEKRRSVPPSAKRRRSNRAPLSASLVQTWRAFERDLTAAERAVRGSGTGPVFAFVEGALVTALKEGRWILFDEINLAPAETLERLSGVLESAVGSVVLAERGDGAAVARHPRFRAFGAMNPATDVGKRDLPPALKHRFTEVYAGECEGREDLCLLVANGTRGVPAAPVDAVVDFYLAARSAAKATLADGAEQKPQYSLRTLSRALEYVRHAAPVYGIQRALYDGFAMSFQTLLKRESAEELERLMTQHLMRGAALKVRRRDDALLRFFFLSLFFRAKRRFFFFSFSFFSESVKPPLQPAGSSSWTRRGPDWGGRATVGAQYLFSARRTEKCGEVSAREERRRTFVFSSRRFAPSARVFFSLTRKRRNLKRRAARSGHANRRFCCVLCGPLLPHNPNKPLIKREPQAVFKAPAAPPGDRHELVEQYWVEAGDGERADPERSGRYVVTPGVKKHLSALARAALLKRHPILLQGPTSSGKTSLVEYLAERTGHRFVRINNHEHTDLQEYLGSYVTDAEGTLFSRFFFRFSLFVCFFLKKQTRARARHPFVTRAPSPWARQSWKGAGELLPADRARVPATPA